MRGRGRNARRALGLCAVLGAFAAAASGGGCSSEEAPAPKPEEKESCGDGSCDFGEACDSCPSDCGACAATCGDGTCESVESCKQCPADCGACPPECGDGDCNGSETCSSCAGDCGACPKCGDGQCNGNDTCSSCPGDCGACPPVCGDGDCEGNETWDSCSADCPLPGAVTFTDPQGQCAPGTIVSDGESPSAGDWTWVRADTRQVMWEDGTDIFTFTDTDVPPNNGAKLYIDGVEVAAVACGQAASGCAWFWRSSSGYYLDFAVGANSYSYQDTIPWVWCTNP